MDPIWIIVIVVVALLVLGLVLMLARTAKNKKTERNLHEAQEHRSAAREEIGDVRVRQQEAAAAQARAEEARLEAERAEHAARETRSEAQDKEARVEERIRTADKLDPNVDHKAKDYTPDASRLEEDRAHDPARGSTSGASSPTSHSSTPSSGTPDPRSPESRDLHGADPDADPDGPQHRA